jgi:hypothetical protein
MPRPHFATKIWSLPGKGLAGDQKQVERVIFQPYLTKETHTDQKVR